MPIIYDQFTGTEGNTLSVYSADWNLHPSYTGTAEIASNRARQSGTGSTGYYHSTAPIIADYAVSADYYVHSVAGSLGVTGRMDTSANTFYYARYEGTTALAWQLYKFVAGAATQLGSDVTETLSAGSTYNVKLTMVGSTISLFKSNESSPIISVTDTAITGIGRAGLRAPAISPALTDTTGLHVDNFLVDYIGVRSPSGGVAYGGRGY